MAKAGRKKGALSITNYVAYKVGAEPTTHELSSVELPQDVWAPRTAVANIYGYTSGVESLKNVREKATKSSEPTRLATLSIRLELGEITHGLITPKNFTDSTFLNLERCNRKVLSEIYETIGNNNVPVEEMTQDVNGTTTFIRLDLIENLLGHPAFPKLKVIIAHIPDLYMSTRYRTVALFKDFNIISDYEARGIERLTLTFPDPS